MAKSRDLVKERYWRGVVRRFEASGLGCRRFAPRKGSPSSVSIGGRESYDSGVEARSDAGRRRGPARSVMAVATSSADRLSFP